MRFTLQAGSIPTAGERPLRLHSSTPMLDEFDDSRLIQTGRLFEDSVEDDLWIAYHGTSSVSGEEIERRGFEWRPTFSRNDVEQVVTLFEHMAWAGKRPAGLAVLRPFTLQHDFDRADSKPVFFAETSLRAARFATRDFAGGETARALRACELDLRDYLVDPGIWRPCSLLATKPACQPSQTDVQARFEALEPILARARQCLETFTGGIVYAVRFRPDDLPSLRYSKTMGLKLHRRLSGERIASKASIPVTFPEALLNVGSLAYSRRFLSIINGPGVVGEARRRTAD